jgi:hypothetical protein
MNRLRFGVALAVVGLLVAAAVAGADVKSSSKSQMKFEGALGRVMGIFGGKAAKEGTASTVAVKGERKVTTTDDTAEIVDLTEEKIYELNIKDKTYKVVTFAEMRKQMEEARARADEEARKQRAAEGKKDPNAKEMQIDFSAKETGQRRQINGFDCRQVVTTMAMHEKGKTLDEAGGMLVTTDMWLAPRIAAMKEVADFETRYWKKMALDTAMPSAEQMMQVFAMYPGLKDGMARLEKEQVNMDGTAIETVTTMQSVQSKEQAAQKKQDEPQTGSPAGGLGGMLGRFGKKKEEPKPADAPPKASPDSDTRATIMTTTNTLLSVSTSVSAEEVAVPATFKLRK